MQTMFDTHFHVIDPQFPLVENDGFVPDAYGICDYLAEMKADGITPAGGVVVSGSFQGSHEQFMIAALAELGENFVGVIQLSQNVTDRRVEQLHEAGIRGIRFNLYRGRGAALPAIRRQAERVYELCRWGSEFYLDCDQADENLNALICSLPKASVDHMGMGSRRPEVLSRYLDNGVAVRVTGFGRMDYTPKELEKLIPQLHEQWTEGLMFGSDLPSTRARARFGRRDMAFIQSILPQSAIRKIMLDNGRQWYLT